MEKQEYRITALDQLDAFAAGLLKKIGDHRVVAFYGQLGAGKTTFIQAICRELEVIDRVTSPTFAIVNEYRRASGDPVYHMDFYRILRLEEVYDVGYEEYFYSGHYCFIEWPERVEAILPDRHTRVWISPSPDGTRSCTVASSQDS